MMSKLPKTRLTVYEYKTQLKRATGTVEEIEKLFGIKKKSVLNRSKIIGHVYPEVKIVDLNTSETFYGTANEVVGITGLSDTRVNRILRNNQTSPNWKLIYTGKYIEPAAEYISKKVEKPKLEPVYTYKPVPMSEYAQQLFEHSTRHLRRDA